MRKVEDVRFNGETWYWTIVDEEDGIRWSYRTNQFSEGVFFYTPYEVHQEKGTCDFSLAGYTVEEATEKLKSIYEF